MDLRYVIKSPSDFGSCANGLSGVAFATNVGWMSDRILIIPRSWESRGISNVDILFRSRCLSVFASRLSPRQVRDELEVSRRDVMMNRYILPHEVLAFVL